MARFNPLYSLFFISSLVLASHFHAYEAQAQPPVVKGLSFSFFAQTCPNLETIVRDHLTKVLKKDIGQAPGLLRIFFHDCFVTGCDGSLLLDAKGGKDEKGEIANGGMRTEALKTIDDLRDLVHKQCGKIVSCADITALAAREAVAQSGGPFIPVPLGRRDSLTFNTKETVKLPSPFANTTQTINTFAEKKFDVTDVVAFSGAHTFGRAHCGSFSNRLFPAVDPNMDKTLANNLKATCPDRNSPNTANLDVRTPTVFDNKYYIDLMNRQGVFSADQDLMNDQRTKGLVTSFANDQNLFFQKFADAVLRLSQLGVLTGNQGEIRDKCNAVNKKQSILKSVAEEMVELADQF